MARYTEIDDPGDPRLGDYVALRDSSLRKRLEGEQSLFIAEGETVIRRALAAGHRPRSFLLAPRWVRSMRDVLDEHDVDVWVVDAAVSERLTGFHVHRGALASLHRTDLPSWQDVVLGGSPPDSDHGPGSPGEIRPRRIAILEDLVDHTNVGAAFRSAAALGVDAILVSPRCADPLYRRSVRVSMGTVFQVPWTRLVSWPGPLVSLQQQGYLVAGMTLGEGAITLDELAARAPDRLALVFGTEGHGLTAEVDAVVDVRVTIPMLNGVDSLNVAASTAVAFYATRPRVPGV